MLALKYLLMILGIGVFGSASALVAYDILLAAQLRRLLRGNITDESGVDVGTAARRPFPQAHWIPPATMPDKGSAGQYPCGWHGTSGWKAGMILSGKKASTAALDDFRDELLLPSVARSAPPG